MSWTVRPWLRRTLTAWREMSAAARLALSARSPRRSLTTLLCSLLRSFSSYSKEQRSVVSEKRARRGALPAMPPPQPQHSVAPDRRPRERPHTPGVRGANAARAPPNTFSTPLPPRTRGKRGVAGRDDLGGASTPAHAGQTSSPTPTPTETCLYPRARGANRAKPYNTAGSYSRAPRFSFTANPLASSGTRHTPSKTTGPATASSKTTVR